MPTVVPKTELKNYIGRDLGASAWFRVDQQRINDFADVTLDHQFIHVDPEKAKQTPFGGTIAHGFLTLSLLPHLVETISLVPEDVMMAVNYGFDKLRFLAPVKSGADIRVSAKVLEVTEKAENQFLVKQEVTAEIKGEDKPALIAEWLAMYFCK